MAAFERVASGIPMMDQALDNIRLGDNVVWQVSELEDAWVTDLMMGNFFHLTCPYLFSLDEELKPIYAVGNGEHVCQDFSL